MILSQCYYLVSNSPCLCSSLSIFWSCSPISVIFIQSTWFGQVNNPHLNRYYLIIFVRCLKNLKFYFCNKQHILLLVIYINFFKFQFCFHCPIWVIFYILGPTSQQVGSFGLFYFPFMPFWSTEYVITRPPPPFKRQSQNIIQFPNSIFVYRLKGCCLFCYFATNALFLCL